MARPPKVLQGTPSARVTTRNGSASFTALLGLALLLATPTLGAAQAPTEVPDDVFRSQLEVETPASPEQTLGEYQATQCAAIMAGPNRDRALQSGDCTVPDPLEEGLVTITPEPGTMVLIAVPAALLMLGARRRRLRTRLRD